MRALATLVLTFSLAVCFGCGGDDQASYKDRTADQSADDPSAAVAADPGIGSSSAADTPEGKKEKSETKDKAAKKAK